MSDWYSQYPYLPINTGFQPFWNNSCNINLQTNTEFKPFWETFNNTNFSLPYTYNFGNTTNTATTALTPEEKEEQRQKELDKCYEELMALEKSKKEMQINTSGITEAGKGFINIENEQNVTDEQGNVTAKYADEKDVRKGLTKAKQDMKDGKQTDGSCKKTEKLKNLKWYKKAGVVVGGTISGFWKMATNFLAPRDENGKINWGKALKNIGIATLCGCLHFIPVVGSFISTALLYAGYAAGICTAIKGVIETCKLNGESTADELKASVEDTATGIAVAYLSRLGIKGMNSGATKISYETVMGNGAKGFLKGSIKNATILGKNSFRGAIKNANADKAMISALKNRGNSTLKAFGKVGFKKVKTVWNKNASKDEFNKNFAEKKTALETKLQELDTKISTATNAREKALLKFERDGLKKCYEELLNATTKEKWGLLGKKCTSQSGNFRKNIRQLKRDFRKNGNIKIGQRKFKADNFDDRKLLTQTLNKLKKDQRLLQKDFAKLASQKKNYIFQSSFKGIDATEVSAYTGKSGWLKNLFQFIKPTSKETFAESMLPNNLIKTAFNASMITFRGGEKVCKSPAGAGYMCKEIAFPVYSASKYNYVLTKEEYETINSEIDEILAQIDAQKAEISKKEDEIYKRIEKLNEG